MRIVPRRPKDHASRGEEKKSVVLNAGPLLDKQLKHEFKSEAKGLLMTLERVVISEWGLWRPDLRTQKQVKGEQMSRGGAGWGRVLSSFWRYWLGREETAAAKGKWSII